MLSNNSQKNFDEANRLRDQKNHLQKSYWELEARLKADHNTPTPIFDAAETIKNLEKEVKRLLEANKKSVSDHDKALDESYKWLAKFNEANNANNDIKAQLEWALKELEEALAKGGNPGQVVRDLKAKLEAQEAKFESYEQRLEDRDGEIKELKTRLEREMQRGKTGTMRVLKEPTDDEVKTAFLDLRSAVAELAKHPMFDRANTFFSPRGDIDAGVRRLFADIELASRDFVADRLQSAIWHLLNEHIFNQTIFGLALPIFTPEDEWKKVDKQFWEQKRSEHVYRRIEHGLRGFEYMIRRHYSKSS